jgi:5S rRNA maturation endonuclease (ribonuclease M5)/nucleoside-triphosphatase THEP1
MTLDDFLDKLEGVRSSGGGYVAVCPAHEDGEPSLSITEGEDERILLNCHAGCANEDIVAAMELTFADLFPKSAGSSEPEAIYDYVDEHDRLLYQVLRFPGKQFRQRRPLTAIPQERDDWEWKLGDVRRVLYRLPEVLQAKAAGRTIYVPEGEKDVESLRAEGFVATTNAGGAQHWLDEFTEVLAGAACVIIIADRDVEGRKKAEKLRQALLGRVGALHVMQAAKGKDVSDHLAAGLPVQKLLFVRTGPRRGLISARELADEGLEYLELRERDMPGYQPIPGLPVIFRPARVYILGGYTGDGKSTLAMQVTRELAQPGLRLGYHTNEMSSTDLRNKLAAHKGVPLSMTEFPWKLRADKEMHDRYVAAMEEISEWNLDINFDTAMTAKKIEDISKAQEHDFIIIDHIHRFGWGTERRQLEAELQAITNLSLELNVPILLLAQLRRTMRGKDIAVFPRPTVQEFRETGVIEQESAMSLAIWRQRDEAGVTFTGTNEIIILKNRFTTGRHDQTGSSYLPQFDMQSQLFTMGGGNGQVQPEGGTHDGGTAGSDSGEASVDDWAPS